MECNRDEAMRAKAIAEAKLEQRDFFSAKKFALKAQNLYPGLDGISQMLMTLDVHISAENKINGETDWYGVLAVSPSADENTIKKQFRRLALLLHPDKNSSIGADGAFKLISEAWKLLSDEERRLAYNQRRGIIGFQHRIPRHTGSAPSTGAPSARTNGAPSARTNGAPTAHTGCVPSARTGSRQPVHTGASPSAHTGVRPPAQPGVSPCPSAHTSDRPPVQPGVNPSASTGGRPPAHTGVPPAYTGGSSAQPGASTAVPKAQKKRVKVPSKPASTPVSQKSSNTFWTRCNLCNMQYEYLRMYLNGILRCPSCKKPFKALEMAPPLFSKKCKPVPYPANKETSENSTSQNAQDPGKNVPADQKSGPGQGGPNSFTHADYQQVPMAGKAGNDSTAPSVASRGPTFVVISQVTRDTKRRSRPASTFEPSPKKPKVDVAQASGGSGTASASGPKSNDFPSMNPNTAHSSAGFGTTTSGSGPKIYDFPGMNRNTAQGFGGFGTASGSGPKINDFLGVKHNAAQGFGGVGAKSGFPGMNRSTAQGFGGFGATSGFGSRSNDFFGITRPQPNCTRELTPVETQNMLMANAKKEILKKLSEPRPETTDKAADKGKDKTQESSSKERSRTSSKSQNRDNNRNSEPSAGKKAKQEKSRVSGSACSATKEVIITGTMNVPDSDFHDFDKDRSETSFGDNEVWAAYDDDDGMPRFYALINKVISRKPFKLRISWLNSKTNSEFSNIDWAGSGFCKTSGEFRVGKYEICKSINAFSQRVRWSRGPRGSVLVLPKKDDVWAVYRNWSADWNERTADDVIHMYDMVVVLEDYSEENGVSVAPLMKVVGFRTVFRPNLDTEAVKKIAKEEMFRFSHMVPSHLLTSQEARNVPEGCLELDPAATPMELLQMKSEKSEDSTIPNKGKIETGCDEC
ncbi:hypothetical protein ABFX02_06G102800 [Erythranthe guttata]